MALRDRLPLLRKTAGTAPPTPDPISAALAVEGMETSGWLGPGRPLNPASGYSTRPRQVDYPAGVNISTRPRTGWGRTSFDTLRAIIDAYDAARMCINHRIDDLRGMDHIYEPAAGVTTDVTDAIAAAKTALAYPDRVLPFSAWLSLWLEDVLRYDAGCLYRRRDRAGRVIGLDVVDGTTINLMVDTHGRRPTPPAPAYEQIIHGLVNNWYTTDDLIYIPFRPQPGNPYGLAPIESILLTANTDLRFQAHFLHYFTAGSVPAGFMQAPEDVKTADQLAEWQDYWDALMIGDAEALRQVKWVPFSAKYVNPKDSNFDAKFPEYLLRRVAAAYGVVPQDLGITDTVNRATGETQVDVQFRVNTMPLVRHVEGIITDYLQRDLGLPVTFSFDTGQEKEDRKAEAEAWKIYIESGIASADEARERLLGLPTDPSRPVPRFIFSTRAGPIPLDMLYAAAGPVDPDTAGPADGAALPDAYMPVAGIVPAPAPHDPGALGKVVDEQPVTVDETGQPVVKAGTAGVTAATGIVGSPLAGTTSDEDDEDELLLVKAAETAAFRRFVKARTKAGRWRDFTFTAHSPVEAHRLNDTGRATVRKAAGEVVAAGLAVLAADTGRVLMLQRALDPTDPAAGMWEMPGGHVEDGEDPLTAACREWEEEVGQPIPAGHVVSQWTSRNGVYQGIVWQIGSEDLVNLADRDSVTNPDTDPDGDAVEAVAWWAPDQLEGNPAVRAELAADLDLVLDALTPTVVKTGDGGPKGPDWPGWKFDEAIAEYYAPRLADAARHTLDRPTIRRAVADPTVLDGLTLDRLPDALRQLTGDSLLAGTHAASAAGGGKVLAAFDELDAHVDWDAWQPGHEAAAALLRDGGLAGLLDDADITVRGMTGSLLEMVGNRIADGVAAGLAVDDIETDVATLIGDRAGLWALTETARAMTAAAVATYAQNGVRQWNWLLTAGACPLCVDRAAANPHDLSDDAPPGHPRCRCAASPVTDSVVGATEAG